MSVTFATTTGQQFDALKSGVRSSFLFSMMIEDDRKALVRGLRRRDPELLDRLIEQYQYRLFRYLVYLVRNREHAEDLFQETWVRVLERGHQFDSKWKFETWLFAIARNLVIDWQRKKKPQSFEEMIETREHTSAFEPVTTPEESPLQQVIQQQKGVALQTSLGRIPTVFREVLLLRFQEDMSLDEIASVMSTPLSTVKSRLYRGLDELRKVQPEPRV